MPEEVKGAGGGVKEDDTDEEPGGGEVQEDGEEDGDDVNVVLRNCPATAEQSRLVYTSRAVLLYYILC